MMIKDDTRISESDVCTTPGGDPFHVKAFQGSSGGCRRNPMVKAFALTIETSSAMMRASSRV